MRFEEGFLQKLEYLRIVSMRAFVGRDRADRLARKRGRGLEFADYRQYAPGDDVRHIDWKAYKRLNRLLLRLFDEEQDLPIYLFVDASRSMAGFDKFMQAKRIAAALCYIGLVHFDSVTILPFRGTLGQETVPGRGRGRIFPVFDMLERLEAGGATDLLQSVRQFAARTSRRGVAMVISDFLDPAGFEPGLRLLSSLRHDVFVVHLVARRERDLQALGEVRFVDSESGERLDVDLTAGLAKAYAEAWQAHADQIEAFCNRLHFAYVRAAAEDPFEDIILHTFRQGGFLA
jgi:uncharacterized protein (DUF58 family)